MCDVMNGRKNNETGESNVCTRQLDNICRTCLSKDCRLFNLMEMNADKNKTLANMLYECTSIQVLENDRLPEVICEGCVNKINTWYEFKLNCLKSEQTILDQFDNFQLVIVKSENFDDYVSNSNDLINETSESDNEEKKPPVKWKNRRKKLDTLSETKLTLNHIMIKEEEIIKEEPIEYSNESDENGMISEYGEGIENKSGRLVKVSLVQNENELPSKKDRTLAEEQIERLLKGYRCKICSKTKNNITNMMNHIFFHLDIKRFKCPECEKRFVTTSNVNRHIKDVHCSMNPNKRVRTTEHTCQLCNKVFPSLRRLHKHLNIDHKQKVRRGYDPVTCNICHKTVYNNNALKKHVWQHLQKKYKCDLCSMSYHSEKGLMGHRRVHGEKSGYHCKFCLVTCSTQQELDNHMDIAHENAKVYICPMCSKEFYVEEYLQKHIKNHTAKPKHECKICGRAFLIKSNLTTHSRVHTGEKPYVCKICNAKFSQHSALRFHAAIHNDERRFECNICGTKWKRKIDLTQHMKIHSEIPKFNCVFCGKGFILRKRLTVHLKIHTGEKPFDPSLVENS